MVYEMKLNNSPFEKISSGKKTIELRLFDEKRRLLNVGDEIVFVNLCDERQKLHIKIKALYRYGSFEELFSEIPLEKCGIDGEVSIKEAVESMRTYYSKENEKLHGVLGIKIEPICQTDSIIRKERVTETDFERLFPDGMK